MTTRNLVPRGDSEGKLGISNKRWEEINAVNLKIDNLYNASGSSLFVKGPGIGDIALDGNNQLKISLDATFLTGSLGFNADGTKPSFTNPVKFTADASIIAAIEALDEAAGQVSTPTGIQFSQLANATVISASDSSQADNGSALESAKATDNALVTGKAVVDWVESQNYSTSTGDITNIITNTAGGLSGGSESGEITLSIANTDIATQAPGLFLDGNSAELVQGALTASIGSASEIPVLTINKQGQITGTTTESITTSFNISDNQSDTVTSGINVTGSFDNGNTITFAGTSGEIKTVLADNTSSSSITYSLIDTTVTAGTYGNASTVATFTVDAKGRLTNAAATSISIATSQTDATDLYSAEAPAVGLNLLVKRDGSGNFQANTITADLVGDVSGSVTGTVSTIANHTTDGLPVGSSNKYFTDDLAIAAFSAGSLTSGAGVTVSTANSRGVISIGQPVATASTPQFAGLTLNDEGALTFKSNLVDTTDDGIDNPDTAFHVTLQAPQDLAASYGLVLPPNDGDDKNVLVTDGSGNLSWDTVEVAAGNAVNSFGIITVSGSSSLTADTAQDTLTIVAGDAINITTSETGNNDTLTFAVSDVSDDHLREIATGYTGIANDKIANITAADKVAVSALNISAQSAVSNGLADGDQIIIRDVSAGSGGANSKATMTQLATYIRGKDSGITTLAGLTSAGAVDSTLNLEGSVLIDQALTVAGNLTVNGTTTTVNSTTLQVDDKNIELGVIPSAQTGQTATLEQDSVNVSVASTANYRVGASLTVTSGAGAFASGAIIDSIVSDTQFTTNFGHQTAGAVTFTAGGESNGTANGGGITLKAGNDTDKTFNWNSNSESWTSSEHLKLSAGKALKAVDTGNSNQTVSILDLTTLGSTVTSSSLTSVGTITSGVWQSNTKIASAYLDDDTAHLTTTQTFTGAKTFDAALTVGADANSHDVKFFGDSAGAYLEWDADTDKLELRGKPSILNESSVRTGNPSPGHLLLSTGTAEVQDGDKLGRIDFQAPIMGIASDDGRLVSAAIWAEANAAFSNAVNATDLVFATAASEVAAEKMRLDSTGNLTIGSSLTIGTAVMTEADLLKLDGIEDGTAAANKALVLDDNKDIGTIRNLTINGTFSNGSYTFDASGNVTGLGTVGCGAITTNGDLTVNADTSTFASGNASDPVVIIKNTTDDANGARLRFVKDRGAIGVDDDVAGLIEFFADNDKSSGNEEQVKFAEIKAQVADATDGSEGGKLTLGVASHDGELVSGIILNGSSQFTDNSCAYNDDTTITMTSTAALKVGMAVSGNGIPEDASIASIAENGTEFTLSASTTGGNLSSQTLTFGNVEDEVDVTIGSGTSSKTTISGDLNVTSNLSVASNLSLDGTISVDDQTDSTATSNGSIQTGGGLGVVKDAYFGNDVILASDSAELVFGSDKEIKLAHSNDSGLVMTSGDASASPVLELKNTNSDATGAILKFVKDKGTAGADNDVAGVIEFHADDANQDQVKFAEVKAQVADATDGSEGGKLTLSVASHDGDLVSGIVINGSSQFTNSSCAYNNSTTITMDSTAALKVGMSVSGTGIPAGAEVSSIAENGTEFTLSASTTGDNLSGQTLTFGNINDEVDVTLGNGSSSTVTIAGNLTVSGTTTTVNTVTMEAANAIVFEGATPDEHETTLTIEDPTDDRTITLPDATTQLVGRDTTDTLTNKVLTTPTINGAALSGAFSGSPTFSEALGFSGIGTHNALDVFNAGISVKNGNTTAGFIDFYENSGNAEGSPATSKYAKLIGPASITGNITLTLPATADTLVGKATIDALTNKTIDCNGTGNSITNIEVHNFNQAVIVEDSEGIANNDNNTTIPTSAAIKLFVEQQLGRHGGIFKTDSVDNGNTGAAYETTRAQLTDGITHDYTRDVIFDSSPLVRSHFGPFAFDLGQLVDEGGSDISFFGSTAVQSSDRHFLVIGSTVDGTDDTAGDCKFTGAHAKTP